MSSFKDVLRWYNKKDVVPTLEAMQKKIAFYHDKDIDLFQLSCTQPNLANICLHKSTDAKLYPFTGGDKDLKEKIEKTPLVAHLLFLHAKPLLMKFSSEILQTYANLYEIDASQLYPYSLCQPMPTGIYTGWDIDSETSRFTPRQNKTRSFENMVMSDFQLTRPDCKIESSYTTRRQKKIDRFSVDGFCSHGNTVFQARGCFDRFFLCQELRPFLNQEDIKRGSRRRELDELRRCYIQEKGFTVNELWEREWWRLYKTTTNVKLHIQKIFFYRQSLRERQLLEGIKKGNLSRYVQCNREVPETLRANYANFPPMFKKILDS